MKSTLERAILALHPAAVNRIDYILREQDGAAVIFAWNLPGQPPTTAEVPALAAQYDAAQAQAEADAQALRQQIITLAQSAVGVSLNALTAAQRNALIACLLWKAGGVAPDMTVRPLGQWLQ